VDQYRSAASGPLMCWDLYMDILCRRMSQAECLGEVRAFADTHQWRIDWNLESLLLQEERVVLVTDTAQIIRFATSNMVGMNGYQPGEILGKSPKMFQGKDTDASTRAGIREAILRRIPFKGSLINYRKDGSAYNCLVEEYPVWNRSGELVHFVAFEKIA
jgi:PAS domain S-box-containing protein